jgi:hypothetical protein
VTRCLIYWRLTGLSWPDTLTLTPGTAHTPTHSQCSAGMTYAARPQPRTAAAPCSARRGAAPRTARPHPIPRAAAHDDRRGFGLFHGNGGILAPEVGERRKGREMSLYIRRSRGEAGSCVDLASVREAFPARYFQSRQAGSGMCGLRLPGGPGAPAATSRGSAATGGSAASRGSAATGGARHQPATPASSSRCVTNYRETGCFASGGRTPRFSLCKPTQ